MGKDDLVSSRTLILGMIDEEGVLEAGPLYDVAVTAGLTDQQVRLALRRLVADGTLVHRGGRGRQGTFATADCTPVSILPELRYVLWAYEQDAGRAPWSGEWHLASFSVPESRRPARDQLRRHVRFLGGASVAGGTYVCANPWEEELRALVSRLEVADCVTYAVASELEVAGVSAPAGIASRLWRLDDLAGDWAAFTQRLTQRRADATDDSELVACALAGTVEFSELMERDPLLPPELLPADWPGRAARAAMADAPTISGSGSLAAAARRLSLGALVAQR